MAFVICQYYHFRGFIRCCLHCVLQLQGILNPDFLNHLHVTHSVMVRFTTDQLPGEEYSCKPVSGSINSTAHCSGL